MMKRALFFVIMGTLVLGSAVPTRAAFELERPGARPSSLGGAFCAVADDADTLIYNPAGLGQIYTSIVSMNYVRLMTGLDDGSLADNRIAYVQPVETIGTFGLAWYQRNLAGLYQENVVSLGYGKSLDKDEKYIVGGAVKLLQQDFLDADAIATNPFFDNGTSVLGIGVDIGGLVYFTEKFKAGLSLANLNQPNMALGNGDSVVPLRVRIGAAYQDDPFLATTEVMLCDDHYRFSTGGEAWWFDGIVATRLGLGIGDQELTELTVGLSMRLEQSSWIAQIDYAFINPLNGIPKAGGTHHFNFTFLFGSGFESEEVVEAKALVKYGEKQLRLGAKEDALEAWLEAAEVLQNDETLAKRIGKLRLEIQQDKEAELYIKEGLEEESAENYMSAATAYRKALAIKPGYERAAGLLGQVEVKIKKMSKRQKRLQEQKEQRAARQLRQHKTELAQTAIHTAERTLARVQKNNRVVSAFGKDIDRLSGQLAEAKTLLRKGSAGKAQLLAQDIKKEADRFGQRLKRKEQARARKKKNIANPALKKPVKTTIVPTTVPLKPKKADIKTQTTATADEPSKLRKRARGAYGRAVKIMLDVDKLNGTKYYPNKVRVFKNELGKLKKLLNRRAYGQTIQQAEKLYPKIEKLKRNCEEREKARRAMPTNW